VTEVAAFIKELAAKHNVPMSRVICDEDGVGGGVVDILSCKGFVNGSAALVNQEASYETYKNHEPPKENYRNLRSQCYFHLADQVNSRLAYIQCEDEDLKEKIIEDLEQVKRKDPENDETKLQVVSREDMYQMLGRSPDYASFIMMRKYFDLAVEPQFYMVGVNGDIINL
jgi:phage terminase large subunit